MLLPKSPTERVSWIYELVRSYNRHGVSMLGDQRRHNGGAEPLLNDEQVAQLWQVLQSPQGDGGLWNGPKVARWMSELLGRPVAPQRGWEYLKGLEMRLRHPRPQHSEASRLGAASLEKKVGAGDDSPKSRVSRRRRRSLGRR